MVELSLILLLGSFLFLPLVFILFLILLGSKKRDSKDESFKQGTERYEWEHHIDASHKKKSEANNKGSRFPVPLLIAFIVAAFAFFLALSVVLLLWMVPSVFDSYSQPKPAVSADSTEETDLDEVQDLSNSSGIGLDNVTPTGFKLSFPETNFSWLNGSRYGFYLIPVVVGLVIIAGLIGILIYRHNRKKMVVIKKAKKTADKLAMKKLRKDIGEDPEGSGSFTPLLAILIVVLLFLITVYIFLEDIKKQADPVIKILTAFKGFVSVYLFYIIAGVASLVAVIVILQYLERRKKVKE